MNARSAGALIAVVVLLTVSVCLGHLVSRAESLGGEEVVAPHEHFAIADAATLDPNEAQSAYSSLIDVMTRGYAASAETMARRYVSWHRFNAAPYRSETHGNRYVNTYANPDAVVAGYGRPGRPMPPGAVLAKDSFTATSAGRLWPGALFIMEKLAEAASRDTGDWRYLMIMPDGSTFGDSRIEPDRMAFCHACHAARADDDYLYFLPDDVVAVPAPTTSP